MRQIQQTQNELVLRFVDVGNHGLSRSLVWLGHLGAGLLMVGLWLGLTQTPLLALLLVAAGSLLALVGRFVPRLYPEVATCVFDRRRNQITVTHAMPGRKSRQRLRDRNIAQYSISDITSIEIYRSRRGLLGSAYTLIIELGRITGCPAMIRIDGGYDQIALQLGQQPAQLLAKEISYSLGRRLDVGWTYVSVPRGLDPKQLGRNIKRSFGTRRQQPDLCQLASAIEQFIWTP